MVHPRNLDIESFQSEVLQEIRRLKNLASFDAHAAWSRGKRRALRREGARGVRWLVAFALYLLNEMLSAILAQTLRKGRNIDLYAAQARELTRQQIVQQRLCTALHNVEDDASEVAKAITPVLVSLVTANEVSADLDAQLFGMSAWLIVEGGVARYCAER